MNISKLLPFSILFLINSTILFSQPSNEVKRQIDSIVNSQMNQNHIVGMSVGIIKDDVVYYLHGYGTTEINKSILVDSNTGFHVASI